MNDKERWQQLARSIDPGFGMRNQQDVEAYANAEFKMVEQMEELCRAGQENKITLEQLQALLKTWLDVHLTELKMEGEEVSQLSPKERQSISTLQRAQHLKTAPGREAAVEVFQQVIRQIQPDDPRQPVAHYIMRDGTSKQSLANSDNLTRSYIQAITILHTTPL